jgi:predicted alpha/beta-hydrolase family hydrolase
MSSVIDLGGLPAIAEGSPSSGSPGVLLSHGAGGDKSSKGLTALAKGLSDAGHFVVRFDLPYRVAGRSSPPKAEQSIPGFVGALEAARTQFPGHNWVVGGKSYGGRVASLGVAQGMEAAGLLFYGYPLHAPGRKANPRTDHWSDIGVPALFLQGSNDALCDLDILKTHLDELGSSHQLIVVEGGDHSLKVTAKRAPDGKATSEEEVAKGLAPQISSWISKL